MKSYTVLHRMPGAAGQRHTYSLLRLGPLYPGASIQNSANARVNETRASSVPW